MTKKLFILLLVAIIVLLLCDILPTGWQMVMEFAAFLQCLVLWLDWMMAGEIFWRIG